MKKFKHKQVIVVRADLGMGAGKLAAQVAHGSIMAFEQARQKHREWVKAWLQEKQKKVVVKVASERELRELQARAKELGLPCELVRDAGLTELPPGTITALGIGPAPSERIDKVTGGLPLL